MVVGKKRPFLTILGNIGKYTTLSIGVAMTSTVLYVSALCGIELHAIANSPILCKGEARTDPKKCCESLESLFQEEKAKLGILEKKIDLVFLPKGKIASSVKIKDTYRISLDMDCTLAELRHELYHIADGHCDLKFENKYAFRAVYLFYMEPQAALYSAFGWKL